MKLTDFEMTAVKKAASLMLKGLHNHYTIDQLAGSVNLSRRKFIEAFKIVYHQSPGQYLVQQKMQFAMALLKDSVKPVKHVAAAVGYDNVSAFVRAFKREVGTSPLLYRKQHEHSV